jgi:hypothetical protein
VKRLLYVVLATALLGVAPVRPPSRPPPLYVARILSDEKAPGAQVLVLDHALARVTAAIDDIASAL